MEARCPTTPTTGQEGRDSAGLDLSVGRLPAWQSVALGAELRQDVAGEFSAHCADPAGRQRAVMDFRSILPATRHDVPDGAHRERDAGSVISDAEEGRPGQAISREGNREAIVRLSGKLRNLTRLPHPDAPGATVIVGEADPGVLGEPCARFEPVGVAGCDRQAERAFEACVGEAAEFLSQLEHPADRDREAQAGMRRIDAFERCLARTARAPGAAWWMRGHALGSGEPVAIPADLCLRRRHGRPPRFAIGSGIAAARTMEEAGHVALLELIERDAVASWWYYRKVPARRIDEDRLTEAGLPALLASYRQGRTGKTCSLIDIRSRIDIPVVAAYSFSSTGEDFACGFAARPSLEDALSAATREMIQMELGHHLVRAKRQLYGLGGLGPADRAYLARSQHVRPDHPRLRAVLPAPARRDGVENRNAPLEQTTEALSRSGCAAYLVDLTRHWLGIPVIRALATGLRPIPSPEPQIFDKDGRYLSGPICLF